MFSQPTFRRLAVPFAINSTAKDLSLLQHIPRENWVGVSEDKGLIPGNTPGFENHVVGGFGKDPVRADQVMTKNYKKVLSFFKDYAWKHASSKAVELNEKTEELAQSRATEGDGDWGEEWNEALESIPFALLVVGLGGGTGCGIAANVAKAIRESSSVTTTIIVVGILPATFDSTGSRTGTHRQAWNALFALEGMEPYVDGVILVDNEALAHTGNPETFFNEYNAFIGSTLTELFAGHLIEEIDLSKVGGAALPVIDIQDIRSALLLSRPGTKAKVGYSSMGWGALPTRSISKHILGLKRHEADMNELCSVAMRKQSLCNVHPRAAKKSLGLLRLPIEMVRDARQYPKTSLVEEQLAECSSLKEVHFGITATRKSVASLITLFTFERKDIDRLKKLEALAKEYQRGIPE
jgi:tubulin-like protein CetZ